EPLDDEQNLFLFEMDMVGRAFAGLVPRHDDRGGAAGGLGGEEHSHVEAERLDRQRLFGRTDSGLPGGTRVHGYCLQVFTTFSFVEPGIAGTPAVAKSSAAPQPTRLSVARWQLTSRRSPRRLRYSPLRPIYRTMQDLNDLYYFVSVVDHGGFAAAGRTLG